MKILVLFSDVFLKGFRWTYVVLWYKTLNSHLLTSFCDEWLARESFHRLVFTITISQIQYSTPQKLYRGCRCVVGHLNLKYTGLVITLPMTYIYMHNLKSAVCHLSVLVFINLVFSGLPIIAQ